RDSTVVGYVEPLMGIHRDGIGLLDPGCEVAAALACARPKPEGPVYMHPGACRMGDRDQPLEIVEGADVQVASLQDHDRGPGMIAEGIDQGGWFHRAILSLRQDLERRGSEAEQAHAPPDARMDVAAGHKSY